MLPRFAPVRFFLASTLRFATSVFLIAVLAAPLLATESDGRLGELRDDILIHDGVVSSPRVVLDALGNSIHVWTLFDEIHYRIFDVSDGPLVDSTQLNTTTDGDQWFPDVATQPDGSFFAIWRSHEAAGRQIRGRYYDAVTGLQAADQLINDLGPAGSAGHNGLGVAALDGGGFVVVWESTGAPGDSGYSVRGRHFNASGAALGDELQMNTTTATNQWNAQVARNTDHELLVVFESGDQAETVVRGRVITSAAVPTGSDFLVTQRTDINQYRPQVAGGPHDFVVVWQRLDGSNDIVGRIVIGPGEFDAPPFRVNDYQDDSQQFPAVGANQSQARVSWKGINNLGANSNALIGRGFQLCLLCDDFERGDTSRWSAVSRKAPHAMK